VFSNPANRNPNVVPTAEEPGSEGVPEGDGSEEEPPAKSPSKPSVGGSRLVSYVSDFGVESAPGEILRYIETRGAQESLDRDQK
jgi:hypothetical protein